MLLESSDGEVFASRGVYHGESFAFADVPPELIHAVIAIEDRRFYSHHGIDIRGIVRAASRNLQSRQIREGGSTITQQLARWLFFSPERTTMRKIREIMLALWLESRLSKDEILHRYLSKVYFGAGAYGASAAAQRYFNKPLRELSLSEAALLAGLIQAPSRLAPTHDMDGAQKRTELVLQAMVETGYLDEAQADHARANPAKLAVTPSANPGTGYFADWINNETQEILGMTSGDFVIQTTLDLELQSLAEHVITHRLAQDGKSRHVTQAALLAMGYDGAVLAMAVAGTIRKASSTA